MKPQSPLLADSLPCLDVDIPYALRWNCPRVLVLFVPERGSFIYYLQCVTIDGSTWIIYVGSVVNHACPVDTKSCYWLIFDPVVLIATPNLGLLRLVYNILGLFWASNSCNVHWWTPVSFCKTCYFLLWCSLENVASCALDSNLAQRLVCCDLIVLPISLPMIHADRIAMMHSAADQLMPWRILLLTGSLQHKC